MYGILEDELENNFLFSSCLLRNTVHLRVEEYFLEVVGWLVDSAWERSMWLCRWESIRAGMKAEEELWV